MEPKLLFWDIESIFRPQHVFKPNAGLRADLGFMLTFGYKFIGEDAHCIILKEDDLLDRCDRELVSHALEILSRADRHFTWNGTKHDFAYLTSKAVLHGLPIPDPKKHVDLYTITKRKLRLSSYSLENVARFLNVKRKRRLGKDLWLRMLAGDYASLYQTANYCANDASVVEGIYSKLWPLVPKLKEVKHAS